jgi:glutathione S-transferase
VSDVTLIIGSKNTSSWSLRPWLALTEAGIAFQEIVVPLGRPETAAALRRHSPTGKVPVLRAEGQVIAESLAICEYAAELRPHLWPEERAARAVARAAAAEMHAGFASLRRHRPMDFTARHPAAAVPAEVARDLERIGTLWRDCRERFGRGGPFLFGRFGVADAMYAPVVSRFVTYALPRDAVMEAYIEAVMGLRGMWRWAEGARTDVAA